MAMPPHPYRAFSCLAFSTLLLTALDVPKVYRFRQPPASASEIPAGEAVSVLPDLTTQKPPAPAPPAGQASKSDRLQDKSRLEIVRKISGEFCHAVVALPGGKGGLRIHAGKPLDEKNLHQSVTQHGAVISAGDQVQITQIQFREKEIVFDINGGARKGTRLRDRIHLEVGGLPTARVEQTGAPGLQRNGATLYLDFGGRLPDLTPEQLQQELAGILDFSKQRSASVLWVDTLPPEFQKAIEDKRAVVGMDQEMVIAAMGRPEKKVRERDADGLETEDWIYGRPPGRTVFVKFSADKVISIKQFP